MRQRIRSSPVAARSKQGNICGHALPITAKRRQTLSRHIRSYSHYHSDRSRTRSLIKKPSRREFLPMICPNGDTVRKLPGSRAGSNWRSLPANMKQKSTNLKASITIISNSLNGGPFTIAAAINCSYSISYLPVCTVACKKRLRQSYSHIRCTRPSESILAQLQAALPILRPPSSY